MKIPAGKRVLVEKGRNCSLDFQIYILSQYGLHWRFLYKSWHSDFASFFVCANSCFRFGKWAQFWAYLVRSSVVRDCQVLHCNIRYERWLHLYLLQNFTCFHIVNVMPEYVVLLF